uniref:Uncharacterized protein n=1 Tax=Cynoglossus semilaevis TaxID=244447 RepID=A0A3P8WD51_CYNSE
INATNIKVRTYMQYTHTYHANDRSNQSKCFQNYLDFHRCNNALAAKDQDISPCQWYQSLVPGLVGKWDEKIEQGTFPGKI